jgi:restriction endonuclease S subunit
LPRDVILTKAGAILGYSAVFPDRWNEGNITSHSVTIRCGAKLNPHYLSHYLRSTLGNRQVYRWGNKSTRPELNTAEVGELLVVVPPPPVQDKIANLMDEAYHIKKEKETEAERIFNSIEEYVLDKLDIKLPKVEDERTFTITADAIYSSRFDPFYYQPKYVLLEEAINRGRYPIGKLGDFISFIRYGASVKNIYVNDGIPLLRILNLKPHELDLTDVVQLPHEKRKEIGNAYVEKGDFLISRSGTIGVTAIVSKEEDGYAYGSFMIRFKIHPHKLVPFYLSVIMNSSVVKQQLTRLKIGAIQGNITIPAIKNVLIPTPPLAIQEEIALETQERRQQAKKLEQEAQEILQKVKEKTEQMILGGKIA